MFARKFVVIFLMMFGFGFIQNQQQKLQGFSLWQHKPDVLKMEKLKETFNREYMPVLKGAKPIDEEDDNASEEMVQIDNKEAQIDSEKLKNHTEAAYTIPSKDAPAESVKIKDLPVLKNTIPIDKKENKSLIKVLQNKTKEEQMDTNNLKGVAGPPLSASNNISMESSPVLKVPMARDTKVNESLEEAFNLESNEEQIDTNKLKRDLGIFPVISGLVNLVHVLFKGRSPTNKISGTNIEGSGDVDENEEDIISNRVKREAGSFPMASEFDFLDSSKAIDQADNMDKLSEEVSIDRSIDSKELKEDSDESFQHLDKERRTLKFKPKTAVKVDKFKRQTSITGNGNRLNNFINLPSRINILANVLSELNLGVVDPKKDDPLSGTTITGNDNTISSLINAPVDVDAIVNILSKVDITKPDSTLPSGGPKESGGLLGGLLGGGGDKGLAGGLLGGLLGNGAGSGLLDGLLGDTLGDLLGGLLGSVGGKHLVMDLLDNLLAVVGELVDNLLTLLLSILDGLLKGLDGLESSPHLPQSGGEHQGGAPSQGLNIDGDNNVVSSLINAPIRINALINVLSSIKKEIGQQMHPTGGSSSGTHLPGSGGSGGTSIKGDNNVISSLLNVAPDINIDLNLLSQITEILGGAGGSGGSSGGSSPGSNPNEICFDIPISQAGTSIKGSGNTISNAINISPKINLDLNLLSKITQTGAGNVPTQRVCITKPTTTTTTTPAPPTTDAPNQICFDVLVDQSGTVISGDNNKISSLINVNPKINLILNLLSNVKQTGAQSHLTVKRICIPVPTVSPPTPSPTTPSPPTEKPVTHPPGRRCYRRTCTRWKHFLDFQCLNKPDEYPKYTYTKDVY